MRIYTKKGGGEVEIGSGGVQKGGERRGGEGGSLIE